MADNASRLQHLSEPAFQSLHSIPFQLLLVSLFVLVLADVLSEFADFDFLLFEYTPHLDSFQIDPLQHIQPAVQLRVQLGDADLFGKQNEEAGFGVVVN